MHASSLELMQEIMQRCMQRRPQRRRRVLDVGGADVNGSYRALFGGWHYETLDFRDADYVVDGYDWPIEDETFDLVVSGQTLEHDPCFWLTVANMRRVVKRNGLLVIVVPSRGKIHRYPVDCYRFHPDAMTEMAKWARLDLVDVLYRPRTRWGDVAGVFRRPRREGS